MSVKELCSFLGATDYYRKFVPKYADIAEPLHALTRADAVLAWEDANQIAFDQLKRELFSNRLLAHFDLNLNIVGTTDASDGDRRCSRLSAVGRLRRTRRIRFEVAKLNEAKLLSDRARRPRMCSKLRLVARHGLRRRCLRQALLAVPPERQVVITIDSAVAADFFPPKP